MEIQSLTPEDDDRGGSWPTAGKRPQAVRWLSPPQLIRTGREVAQSALFAKFADKRETEASAPRNAYDLGTAPGKDIWVDYVADTGDGFNATFAVACSVAGASTVRYDHAGEQPGPEPDGGCTIEGMTPADLLVFGGDEVYPVASARGYQERLNNVYAEAFSRRAAGESVPTPVGGESHTSLNPPVVALPGNHDWYDGLVSFRRNFCQSWVREDHDDSNDDFLRPLPSPESRDGVGGWTTFQSRSYFAVRLAYDWWLWGIDIQLDAPIDAEQLDYFRRAAELLDKDGGHGNVVLCTARPSWVDPPELDETTLLSNRRSLVWFVQRILGADRRDRLRLMLSGDLHHYARYTATARTDPDTEGAVAAAPELITCGGGGAFLSSTHHLSDELTMTWNPKLAVGGPATTYRRAERYPSKATSEKLLKTLLYRIIPRNEGLAPFVAGIYLVLFYTLAVGQEHAWWPRLAELHWPSAHGGGEGTFVEGLSIGWLTPFLVCVALLVLLLLVYAHFGSKEIGWRVAAPLGLGHAVAHVLVLLGFAALIGLVSVDVPGVVVVVVAILVLGAAGTTVFGLYLVVADSWRFHETEAFSALRIEDYKCHLRVHVTKDELHIHAVGFDHTPDLAHDVNAPITARQIDFVTVRTLEAETRQSEQAEALG